MRIVRAGVVLVLSLSLVVIGASQAMADIIGEKTFPVVADTVLVNRGGGITVSGTLDCTAAVEEAFGETPIPEEFAVYVNVNWRATQYIGRGKVVTAVWESAVASVCYGNPFPGSGTWQTRYPYPSAAIQWVYSGTGKFQAGLIHIEVWSNGEFSVGDGQYLVSAWSGTDLRAQKVR